MSSDTHTAPMDSSALSKLFKALAHPTRIQIIEHLKAIDQCICGEIVQLFPLAQSTVSQHLRALKEAGLIKGEVEGPRTCYCIDNEALDQFKEAVTRL
jgi:DNA-binding transcriptional ArsR family regulator